MALSNRKGGMLCQRAILGNLKWNLEFVQVPSIYLTHYVHDPDRTIVVELPSFMAPSHLPTENPRHGGPTVPSLRQYDRSVEGN